MLSFLVSCSTQDVGESVVSFVVLPIARLPKGLPCPADREQSPENAMVTSTAMKDAGYRTLICCPLLGPLDKALSSKVDLAHQRHSSEPI